MKNKKEEWINTVLNSMEGHKKAVPNPMLFDKINAKIKQNAMLPIRQWQLIAAATILILINIITIQEFVEKSSQVDSSQVIISDYQIYE